MSTSNLTEVAAESQTRVEAAPLPANDLEEGVKGSQLRDRLWAFGLMTAVLVVIAWRGTTYWAHVAIGVWTAYFLLGVTSVYHEFIHRLDSSYWKFWARIIGLAIVTPARAYRESHVRHHAYLNRPADWELWPYSDPTKSRTFRRAFAWVDLMFGLFTHPFIYGRIYWSRNSPLTSEAKREITWEYIVAACVWGTICTALTVYGQWFNFMIAWGIPCIAAGVMQTSRKFTEHLGMASYEPLEGTRTVYGGNWFTNICSWLNSDIFIHGPHHRSPKVTADELHEFAAELSRTSPDLPFYKSYTAAFCAMLPHFLHNPGVGENSSDFVPRNRPTEAAAT